VPKLANSLAAWNFHEATKHSYSSVRVNPHFLDFDNQPLPFKIYPTLEPVRLPSEVRQTGVAALSAIAGSSAPHTNRVPTLEALAQLLYLSAGITRQRKYAGGEIYFRAAACTGALYEVELYPICGNLDGLAAGVYHFAPAEFGLRQLRAGDYRSSLVEATGGDPAIVHAPLTIVCTCTYWRNAWKYQARTYRHFGWDNGTLLANLLAVASALGLSAKVVCGFVDAAVNRLLDIDTDREVAFSLVALGHDSGVSQETVARAAAGILPLALETVPLSASEIDYPLMREVHAASSLASGEEVADWRAGAEGEFPSEEIVESGPQPGSQSGPRSEVQDASRSTAVADLRLEPFSDLEMPCDPIEQVILRRGSSRQFSRAPIDVIQLYTMLDRSTRGIHADFLALKFEDTVGLQLNHLYLIVNAVEGLDQGAYVFHRNRRTLECLKKGNFRDQAGYLGLEQQLPADAAVDIFFLADLEAIFNRLGNRGYRAVQLEAGILGGKIYLAAYAQHLGATGLTFYDDDVVQFFSPHADRKSAIFLVAVGHSAKQQR
jgi:SagB-type dehydrogenase family enzyme